MRVLTVVGARPQFIKAAPMNRALKEAGHREILVHTGQHYDEKMSAVFFDELGIPEPDYALKVGSASHGAQTAAMLAGIEEILLAERPDWTLVYGDTNSTLAGALAAAKLHTRVAHVEAGLRSFNRSMPEEINRVLTDHIADLLLCPSQTAVDNLAAEGVTRGVHMIGDVMADALAYTVVRAEQRSTILARLGVVEKGYVLATVHRAENTDDPGRLQRILAAFAQHNETIVFPVHPRTGKVLAEMGNPQATIRNLKCIEPVGYLDMVRLEQAARMILTDSGGVQKEAYWLGVPCATLRDETEWVETVALGWNTLVGADTMRIVKAVQSSHSPRTYYVLYGNGNCAEWCVQLMERALGGHAC